MYASNTVSIEEMADPLSRPDKSEENRHYWKIQKVLPKSGYLRGEVIQFKLYNENWWFYTFNDNDRLVIYANILGSNPSIPCDLKTEDMFNIRAGICEEPQEIIAVSEGPRILTYYVVIKKIPIRISELETIMQKNKVVYFFIEITRNNKEITRKRKIEADFEEMLISGKNSDLTIEVNSNRSRNFKCHRNILAARSPVFSAMMQHDMIEKASGIVSIVDAEPAIFQDFLLYLYTGNEEHINRENIIELFKLGDKYIVEDLKNIFVSKGKRKIESDFEEMLISGKNSDVTIEVNSNRSRNFKCHRNILAARSPVLSAMMQDDMIEKASVIVSIVDAEPAIFQDFLLYLYTGNEEHLKQENIIELFKLGDKYIVEDLKNICVEHMKKNISTENLFEFFLLSQQHNETKLTEVIMEFFVKNSNKIVKSEKWIEFLKNNPVKSNMLIRAAINKLDWQRSIQSFLYAPLTE